MYLIFSGRWQLSKSAVYESTQTPTGTLMILTSIRIDDNKETISCRRFRHSVTSRTEGKCCWNAFLSSQRDVAGVTHLIATIRLNPGIKRKAKTNFVAHGDYR